MKPKILLNTGPKLTAELPEFNFDIPVPEDKKTGVQVLQKQKQKSSGLF